ncbi:MAG: hypothetical protein GXY77_07315 [Fibrobacter sp.]|nr:hypothetical protein [Fibrobacter sp.]
MILFIFICLAALLSAFLVMISVQLIRIEKSVSQITEITEIHVKKMYGKKI